jgi:hypothetical protein
MAHGMACIFAMREIVMRTVLLTTSALAARVCGSTAALAQSPPSGQSGAADGYTAGSKSI